MARKFTANFDELAQWYIGEQCAGEQIIEYFEQELGENVRPFIGKNVQIIEKISPNGYFDLIIENELCIEAVEQFA